MTTLLEGRLLLATRTCTVSRSMSSSPLTSRLVLAEAGSDLAIGPAPDALPARLPSTSELPSSGVW